MNCPKHNTELESVSGQFHTGVVAPDGYRESVYEEGFYCEKCNYVYDEDDLEDEPETYTCPWCLKDNQTTQQIRKCSGFRPSGMPANETGHYYGCSCSDCRDEYRKLK